jgi:hypothetical protein
MISFILKVYQLLAHGRWFSPCTPASFTTKTGRHDIAEILLKVALNTKNQMRIRELDHLTIIDAQQIPRTYYTKLHDWVFFVHLASRLWYHSFSASHNIMTLKLIIIRWLIVDWGYTCSGLSIFQLDFGTVVFFCFSFYYLNVDLVDI